MSKLYNSTKNGPIVVFLHVWSFTKFEPISALALYCESSWLNIEGARWQECALIQWYRNKSTFYRGLWRHSYNLSTRYQTGACSPAKKITEDGKEGNRDGCWWELVGNCNSSGTDTSPSFKGLISQLLPFPCKLEFVLYNSKYFGVPKAFANWNSCFWSPLHERRKRS